MAERPDEEQEQIGFWYGWKGLYIFLIVYGVLQILLLYFFTVGFNRS